MEKHFTFPLLECYGFSQDRLYSQEHTGIDMSWWYDKETPLIAVKSGTIVWSAYTEYGGNVIALEMPYDKSHKQWVLYQHCRDTVQYPRDVKQGQQIGNMGNTGHSFGNHLHFTMCEPVALSVQFSYQYAINHTIDPYEHILFKLKGINYKLNDKKWSGGEGSKDLKKIVEFTNDEDIKNDRTLEDIYNELKDKFSELSGVVDEYAYKYEEAQNKLKEINKLSA